MRVEDSIAAYEAWEPRLHAFAWFDRDAVLAAAARRPAGGELDGMPVAVKDVFDTAGVPTEYGSDAFTGRIPEASALAVRRLEGEGAVIFGKTVTAELAYLAPGPTTNPWDAARTPGGSSMGSAAAVAAGIVPAALGTQTNGSVIRPAAFCGAVGFKPSAGRLPRDGVLRFSATLDQVGVFARDVELAARLSAVIADEPVEDWLAPPGDAPVLGVVRPPEWDEASASMRATFDAVVSAAGAAGATLRDLALGPALGQGLTVLRTIMAVEASRLVKPLLAGRLDRTSPQLRALFEEGEAAGEPAYEAALTARSAAIDEFARWTEGVDALITLAVLGEAPPIATTGDPRCCTRWTLVGAPALSLPRGHGAGGLPLGVQLVGRVGEDRRLVAAARWLERV